MKCFTADFLQFYNTYVKVYFLGRWLSTFLSVSGHFPLDNEIPPGQLVPGHLPPGHFSLNNSP